MTDLTAVELRELVVAELVPATDTVTVNEAVIVGAGSSGGGGGSALTVKEEGTSVDTAVSSINFVGGSQTAAQTASGAVTVTSTAYYPGGTDVPVTDGGTGSSTAAGARTNLGLVIGTDVAAQPSGTPTGSKFYRDDGTWASPGGGVTSVDGNTGAITATQLLTSIKTVDGTGSGLDADTLDGQSSAYYATATSVTDHTGDTSDAHDASAISIVDAGAYYTGTDVEAALQEAGLTLSALGDVTTLKKLTSGMTVPINSLDRWKAGPGMPGTKLNGAISSTSATSITVDNASFTPDSTSRHVTIDDEEIAITAGFGTTSLTIARGINGTTAATHSDRAPVLHRKMRRVLLWGDSITGGYIPDYGDGFALRAARVLGANGGGEQGQLFPYWLNSTATPSAPDWAVTGTLANSTAGINYDVGLQGSVILSSGTGNYLTLSRRAGTRWACIDVPWVDYSSTAQNWSYSVDGGSTWTNNPITTSIWSSGRGILRRSRIVVDNPDSFIIRGANAAGTGATIVLPYSGVTVWPSVPVNGTTVGQQWLNAGYGGMRLRIALNSRTVTDGVVTNGSPTVTSATAVFATNYDAGSTIYIEGVAYTISTRDSATQITLTGNYAGSSGTGKRLTIFAGDNTGDRLGSIFGHHGSWVPDLIVCGTWINDIVNSGASHDTSKGDENPDAMTDMLQYVYTKCSDFADLLFVASYEFATTAATSGLQLQYRTNVETVAANNNAACLNLYDAFDAYGVTGYSAMNSAGYMYDSVHLSAKGNRWIGSHFARALGVI